MNEILLILIAGGIGFLLGVLVTVAVTFALSTLLDDPWKR